MRRISAASVVCTLLFSLVLAAQALGSGITNSSDDLRTGWYPNNSTLTPQLVSGGTFGQLWSSSLEGQITAQPLLANGTLLIETEKDKAYGLDPASGAVKWTKSLGTPWNPVDIGCGDITPSIGTVATPVVDPATNIAYMTHKTYAQALPKMQKVCRQVIRHYPKEKGLVLCQGYPMQLDLARGFAEFGARILVHTKHNREEVIARHCESAEPTVLLGVAMFEGLDLKDERARFLIFPKVPYPNLGDPYVAERKRRDEQWYARQVALAIVQGAGRVVRSETDHAEIYMLDSCFLRFINQYEALFPPWFLDAIEFGQTKTKRPHSVARTAVQMLRRRATGRGKWRVWMDRGRLRLSPPWRVP